MIKLKTVPFDWDQYLAGAKVICRNPLYRVVNQVQRVEGDDKYPLTADLCLSTTLMDPRAFTVSFTADGLVSEGEVDSWDLLLELELNVRELWVYLYRVTGANQPCVSQGFPTRYLAQQDAMEREYPILGEVFKLWDSDQGVCHGDH